MKKIIHRLVLMGALFPLILASVPVFAQKAEGGIQFISTEDLSKGLADKSLFVVDANSPEVYQKDHIPTAIHINSSFPDAKILPKDKNSALVFYCKNPHCMASHEAAHFAIKQGYTNVRVYPLGIDGWLAAGKPVETGGH